jgi:transcriptional regulator with XRE-family HTH domain
LQHFSDKSERSREVTRLEFIRHRHGYTQKAVAVAAQTSRTVISMIENRRYIPSLNQLQRIAKALEWRGELGELLEEVEQ